MIPQALDIEIKSVGDQETESLKEINLSFAFYFLPAHTNHSAWFVLASLTASKVKPTVTIPFDTVIAFITELSWFYLKLNSVMTGKQTFISRKFLKIQVCYCFIAVRTKKYQF